MLWAGTAKPFARIATDLHPDNPRFDHLPRPRTPDGAFNCLAAGLEREGVVGLRRRKMVDFQASARPCLTEIGPVAHKRFEHMVGMASRGLGLLGIVLDKMDREKDDHKAHEDLVVATQPQIVIDGALQRLELGLHYGSARRSSRRRNQQNGIERRADGIPCLL